MCNRETHSDKIRVLNVTALLHWAIAAVKHSDTNFFRNTGL